MAEPKTNAFLGTGRRKTSVARVRLVPGTGKLTINERKIEEYITIPNLLTHAVEPLRVTDTAGKYDVTVSVAGGGPSGQAGAIRLGIARALLPASGDLQPPVRRKGLLHRDPRLEEAD